MSLTRETGKGRSTFTLYLLGRGCLLGALGALVSAVLVAFRHDAASAWSALGLLVPVALGAGLSVGFFRALGLLPELGVLRERLDRRGVARRLCLGAAWVTLGWLIAGAVALHGFEQWEAVPRRAGALLALTGLLVLFVLGTLSDLSARALQSSELATRLGDRLGRWRFLVPLAVLALGLALPIALGETAGRGHALALMGVFRRPELDLRPVFDLLGLSLGALLVSWVPSKGPRAERALVALGLGALVVGVWASISVRSLDLGRATAITRGGGLAPLCLQMLAGLDDRDHDGAAAHYAGGDCDDHDPQVLPGAVDVPDNGRDEDCDGQDAQAARAPLGDEVAKAKTPSARFWPEDTNVLLLTVDTLRFDLGFLRPGGGGRLSPRLDELSKRCTVFERAYSLASYTSKSLGPMLIGKYSSEVARTFEHFDRFGKTETFLQERVQAAGHRTVSVQAYWYFFLKGYGFERGWDLLDHQAAPKLIAVDGDASVTGEKLADRTIQELVAQDAHPGRFFTWAHWVDPHSEYVAHAEFDLGASSRARYDGEVAYVDHQLGRVLDALDQRPYAKRTAILITSDHGEAFGEHGMIRHGFELWEELVRVPLLLCVPGSEGRHLAVRRSLIDLAPTVLELLDVPVKPGELRGASLLADVSASEPLQRPVLVDMPRGPNNQERRAFISGNHKLITSAGRVIGLYDLGADPAETNDLSSSESLLETIQAELRAYLSSLQVRAPG